MEIILRRPEGLSAASTYEERMEALHWFDIDTNPAESLVAVNEGMRRLLNVIFGEAEARRQFAALYLPEGSEANEELFAFGSDLGDKLNYVALYASLGLLRQGPLDEVYQELADLIQRCEQVLDLCPPDRWMAEQELEPLMPTLRLARARWNLDNGLSIEPEALAYFGDVKMSRIKNMMAGAAPELPRDAQGWIMNEPAKAWLSKRDCFLPTVATPTQDEEVDQATEALEEVVPIFLPVSRDGSVFTPDIARGGKYQIGEKGNEASYTDFFEALNALQTMPVARWRRPNENGHFGIVAAVEWRRVDRKTLTF